MRWLISASFAATLAACSVLGQSAPGWVTSRPTLPACGEEHSRYGGSRDVAIRQCLLDAYQAGRPAELIVSDETIEGDPLVSIIRVLGPRDVQVFMDATRDRYGSGRWEEHRCDSLQPVSAVNQPDSHLPLDFVFVEVGCHEVTRT